MKTTMIKRAALAAAILAGSGVAYGVESALQVVFCKATIVGDVGEQVVSVTIPPTDGYFDNDGNPLTFWNVGNVPAGGVADSWHQEGGPGRFTARNAGNVGAYFYVTTSGMWNYRKFSGTNNSSDSYYMPDINAEEIFGPQSAWLQGATISLRELRAAEIYADGLYHLAFTTDTMAKVPTWHSLDHRWASGPKWETYERNGSFDGEVAGYMGYVDAGDYLTFDLKFWAPVRQNGNALFSFCVEASAFPLWEHSRAVE